VSEAHRLSGRIVGIITTIGFAVGVALSGAWAGIAAIQE
jgi:hypothetical protein